MAKTMNASFFFLCARLVHPWVSNLLYLPPVGDPRVASIYCQPGGGSQHPIARKWRRNSSDLGWLGMTRDDSGSYYWNHTKESKDETCACLLHVDFSRSQLLVCAIFIDLRHYTRTSCWSKGVPGLCGLVLEHVVSRWATASCTCPPEVKLTRCFWILRQTCSTSYS